MKYKTVWGQIVSRGKDDAERPPGFADTRKLADGMKWSDWKKERRKVQAERRYQQIKANI